MRPARLTVVLTVTCVFLGAWVYRQWVGQRDGDRERVSAVAPVRAAAPVDSAPPRALPMPPLASYSEIVERPLFDASRRPPPEPEVAQASAAASPVNFKLEGTVVTPDGRVAVLRDTRTGEFHRLSVGQSANGWKLDDVGPGEAALNKGATKIQLELEPQANPTGR